MLIGRLVTALLFIVISDSSFSGETVNVYTYRKPHLIVGFFIAMVNKTSKNLLRI